MTTSEVIDVESVPEPTVASLVPAVRPSSALVSPAATTFEIENAFHAYTDLCDRLLVTDDYQQIGQRSFRKKSAWRKLAVAFGVSCEISKRDYERGENGRIVRAEVVVRATAPNGRYMDGLGACDLFERCCVQPCAKKSWSNHTCCANDCSGAIHFSHPQHDIPATASTRATNRACADLFGMGEVSAEEVVGDGEPAPPSVPAILNAEDPWRDVLGNPDGWYDNRENKRNPKGPDFKAKPGNAHWKDAGERDGKPDAMALWLRDAPEGFIEAVSLRDQGLPVDFTLLDGAVMETVRRTPIDAMSPRQLHDALLALELDATGTKPQLRERLRAAQDVGAGETGIGDGRDGVQPTVLPSPATDGLAEANALASRPCENCGSVRAKRVLGAHGQVVCANTTDCSVRVADRAAALKSPCAFAESHGCTKPAVADGLCAQHEAF